MLTSEALVYIIQLWISAVISNGGTTVVSLGRYAVGIIKRFEAKLKGLISSFLFFNFS